MNNKRVVITGAGVVSPIGNNLETFWNGLISGKNGAGLITKFDAEKFTSKVIFEVKDFDFEGVLDIKEARRMDIGAQYALVAAAEAAKNSGLDFSKIDPERAGCISGSGIGGIKSFETEHEKYLNAGPRRVSPFFIVQMIIDIVPGLISIKHNLKGPNYSCVSACATASHSIGDAYYTIQRGDADIMFTGGSEGSISPMAIAGFNSMKALSTRNDDYMTASRPFDKDRDGFVMGEGAGILVLEEYEHAKKR
ncbi:MAG: beta-ketoacyl-[acyl-carrier-protein] synthase II, partial [Calditrichia bacterium]|nr:beta-ketoacyl-[acyl-carrier-protein] synthase II [Calditrichia bacterium]